MTLPAGFWPVWLDWKPIPRPADVKKLKGRDAWRIRVGDYRVIYEIHDRVLQIIVITVGHRREIYR
jgi:mRNA interferase RelE/StbE